MSFIIKGNFSARLCEDCFENLSQVRVRIYLPLRENDVAAVSAAAIKDTFRELSDEEIKAKQNRLIAEAETDMEGNFGINIDEKYSRSAFEIDIYCDSVPRLPHPPKKGKARQFHITTFTPEWKLIDDQNHVSNFQCRLPSKWWCMIKGKYFDVWSICGQLIDCKTKKALPGITVIAMDADFITDDELGRNVTDSNGYFKIFYTSVEFKKTFLSPVINIETDVLLPFASGPDVYFQLEYGGQRFALETKANRRNNVGYCLCVKLCAKELIAVESDTPPSFTHFGLTQHIPIQSGINLATGKTLAGYAFFSSVNLIGTICKKINAQPMEYLFEFQQLANPTDAINPGNWSPIVPNMIDKTVIGYLYTYTGDPNNFVDFEDYYINGTGTEKTVTFNGNWIQVPQESNFIGHADGQILKLNTEKLAGVTTIDMSTPTSTIGSATVSPARPQVKNKYYALRMRQRQQGNAATEMIAGTSKPIAIYNVLYKNVNKNGSWAPSTVSDQYIAVSVDLQEIVAGLSGCSKVTNALHVKYGARNENLSNVSLSITGPHKPGQSFGFDPIALLAAPETFGSTQLIFTPPTDTVADLLPCAYTVSISATALLTTGDGNLNSYNDFVSFCKV
ncbi:hypothetical protein [Kaistella antarctica]|uniref:Transthyretin-like family n=1 Tax=Kaistella antarctica TaxID=266748 RepID=A0A448NTA0_9FLAO|nr:hypothetical protein [Kaistella antarctica]KEY18016.1 hypothetical protein HY04_05680 [Kaistella antarctica]SEV82110.1 hypothetical protein SAMN05421765_0340 [Kaistella antarctica]VEI00512.1 Transthyretin-like family [Kaistella antarctica]